MNFPLSAALPDSIVDLLTDDVFQQYSVAGPNREYEPQLQDLTVDRLFPDGTTNQPMAMSCLSGIWLLHNFLDRSHEISQTLHTREGSFWHAIMHRLEGDFWNSKHWYRQVGTHPVFDQMQNQRDWDPFEFVDQCETAQESGDSPPSEIQSTAVQEWQTLFEYCLCQSNR